jgi:hypothetical protein
VFLSVLSERRIVSVETFYHPLKRIWHDQDGAETTVIYGEWTTGSRSDRFPKRRRHLVSVVRYVLAYGCADVTRLARGQYSLHNVLA